jgi:hypothetical protein
VRAVLQKVPPESHTGLRPRVRVTGAASFASTRDEGGTFNDLKNEFGWSQEQSFDTFDLNTFVPGQAVALKPDKSNFGEWIFWGCLRTVLETKPDDLSKVWVTVVSEPGKARTVTKT